MRGRQTDGLPQAKHPFARWCAAIAISFWALGVQELSTPLSKFGALLSPGVGYLLGLSIDWIIVRASARREKREQEEAAAEKKREQEEAAVEKRREQDRAAAEKKESFERNLSHCATSIGKLQEEREDAMKNGADDDTIKSIDSAIIEFRNRRVRIIAEFGREQ